METITIAKVKNLITARPKEMPFDVYRKLRKEQQLMLHGYSVLMLHGYSVVEKQNGVFVRRHIPGRLEGVCIPPERYTNSRNIQIVLK